MKSSRSIGEDTQFAVYDACEAKVPRGGNTTKSFTTTNLVHHLMTKHPEIHTRAKTDKGDEEMINRVTAFSNGSARSNEDLGYK